MFAQMITKAVKAHNTERNDLFMEKFNKGLKFKWMELIEGKEAVKCSDGNTMTCYRVGFNFKAPKYENNVVFYEVAIYTDGSMSIYFDGTSYEA